MSQLYIGNWQLDSSRHALLHAKLGEEILRPKVAAVLKTLADRQGEMVTREELVASVWEGNQYVGERGVNDAIWQLRKILDQDNEAPYIETIPRKGYRLLSTTQKQTSVAKYPSPSHVFWLTFIFIAITLVYFLWISVGNKSTKQVPRRIESITALPGSETSPRFSHDGRFLAYTHIPAPGVYNLHLLDLTELKDKREAVPLFDDKPSAFGTFSNDSQEIMFATQSEKDGCDIHIMSLATRQSRLITQCQINTLTGLDWSRNERYILYGGYHEESKSSLTRIYDIQERKSRWLTSSDEVHPVSERNMRFSPSGQLVAVVRIKGVSNSDIYIFDISGQEQQIIPIGSSVVGLDWLGEESLVFGRINANKSQLFSVNLASGDITILLPSEQNAAFPDYSESTNQLAFRKRSLAKGLFTLDIEPKPNVARVRPLQRSPSVNHYPNFSSKTGKTAFVSDSSGYDELWVTNKSGNQTTQLTFLQTQVFSPAFSPDGDKIAFTASPKDGQFKQIFIYHLSDGELLQITDTETDHAPPTWSSDGLALYYGINSQGSFYLWQHPLKGSPVKMMDTPAIYGVDHPARATLLYTEMKASGIWEYDPVTQEHNRILETNSRIDGSNWTVSDSGIYFVIRTDEQDVVNYYDFETRSQETLLMLPEQTISGFNTMTYIEESKQLIFVQNMMQGSDIHLVENLL